MQNFKTLGMSALAFCLLQASVKAQTTTYQGNGGSGFGGPVGSGMLTFTNNGTTLTGTINQGNLPSGFNDELVIYIDSKAGGFTSTSTFTDNGGGNDTLRAAISGLSLNGTARATLNFAGGFGADYAIALSPAKAQFGALYTLSSAAGFTYGTDNTNGNANLTPTGTNTAATYTFSIPLALIGSPSSFNFATTYLDGNGGYRSNEAFGNMITDTDNPQNTGNLGQDTGLVGYSTYNTVPEPSTWMMGLGLVSVLILSSYRQRKAV